jgi:hypothetical protein
MSEMNREIRRATSEVILPSDNGWNANMPLKIYNTSGGIGFVATPGHPNSLPNVYLHETGYIIGAGPEFGNGRLRITFNILTNSLAIGNTLVEFTNMPEEKTLNPG